ncbi:MAG: peptidylprolyl isomerase, partial [Myxococcota bacterium]|nr:peptidylprolyl isomerase [Myxococcota bacterium]
RAALSPPVDDERLLELAWLANLRGFPAIVERDLTFPQHPVRPLSGKESRYKSMVPAFANAAFALSEAEPLSDPVRTEYGVHIISFKRRLPGHRPSLDLVSDEIRREIANFRRASGVDALLAERRKSASIEVDDELLRSIATSLSLGTQ